MNLKLPFIILLFQIIISKCNVLRCGPNEYLSECGNQCEPQCFGNYVECYKNCNLPACTCKKGYFRTTMGKCVTLENCKKHCDRHEYLNECGNKCEPNCIEGDVVTCTLSCDPPACACKKGFYRSMTGQCVTQKKCT